MRRDGEWLSGHTDHDQVVSISKPGNVHVLQNVSVSWMCLSCCLQIKHMMAFIEQEANEKAEEIDAKV